MSFTTRRALNLESVVEWLLLSVNGTKLCDPTSESQLKQQLVSREVSNPCKSAVKANASIVDQYS